MSRPWAAFSRRARTDAVVIVPGRTATIPAPVFRLTAMLAVLHVLGQLLIVFGATYLLPLIASLVYRDGTATQFILGAVLTSGAGLLIAMLTRAHRRELKSRDGFLLVTLAWVLMSAAATLPLLVVIPDLSFTDAYFETVSGLTTTGSTILVGLDTLPPALNLWRHALHWYGGMGIIVLALAILPLLGVGGMQLYKAESPGPVKDAKLTPRITGIAKSLWFTYAGITLACVGALMLAGMNAFDAICHAFSAVGLGGFSTHDASIGYFHSGCIEAVLIVFMVIAALNFSRHFLFARQLFMGKPTLEPYRTDPEAKALFLVLGASIVLVTAILYANRNYPSLVTDLRHAAFMVVTMATTSGFVTENYELWPPFVGYWLLMLTCICCSTGSTGGGIKMFRTLLLWRQATREMRLMVHPQAVEQVRIGGQVIQNRIVFAVLAFVFLYFMTIVMLTFVMLLSGLDFQSAFSAVLVSVNNAGPGLNRVGPATNYQSLSDFQTWVCSVAMLVGRLEVFSVLVLFTPAFWRK